MAGSNPRVLTTDWDEWEHPKRAIAAIWFSVVIGAIIFLFSLPMIFDSSIDPAIAVGIAVILFFAIPPVTAAIMARFD